MKLEDIIVALIFIIVAVFVILSSQEFPPSSNGVPGAKVFPILISIIILLASISIIIVSIVQKKKFKSKVKSQMPSMRIFYVMLTLIVYGIILRFLGFVTTTAPFLYFLIQFTSNNGKWYYNLIYVLITVSIIYLVFRYLLDVPLNFGILI